MRYSKWDEVVLKVPDNFGYRDKVVSHLKVTIIGVDYETDDSYAQYLCYIPHYENVPYGFKTFSVTRQHVKHFDLDEKFLGETGCFITAITPIHKHVKARRGETCDYCHNWVDSAEKTNNVFVCYSCRENPYR